MGQELGKDYEYSTRVQRRRLDKYISQSDWEKSEG